VKTTMVMTTPDSLTYKSSEEELVVNASKETLTLRNQTHPPLSASDILALVLDQTLNLQSKLVIKTLSVTAKEKCQLTVTMEPLTALIL